MVIELSAVQFWSEIILVISNQTRAARSLDFEITRMISDQIALHLVQLPLLIIPHMWIRLARQELEETMTLKSGLEQQGQTILNFHFLIVTLMTGTLYKTPLCLLPA